MQPGSVFKVLERERGQRGAPDVIRIEMLRPGEEQADDAQPPVLPVEQ